MATTLAERMSKFSGSPTSALIAKVAELKRQGKDIISLNVGEPDFGTPDYIKVAGMKAIADNFTKYTPGNGILELRQEIVKKLKEDNGVEYVLNEVTTAVGAKQAIASAMMVIAGPGDEVLLPIPCWVSYTEMIRLAGATPVFVPVREDNYELDLDAIEQAITPRTKAIIICTPNNPTGRLVDGALLRAAADQCRAVGAVLAVDECFLPLSDGAGPGLAPCLAEHPNLLLLRAFTKSYAMAGLRLGYALSANGGLLERMAAAGPPWSVSTPAQAAGLAALEQCSDWPEKARALLASERPALSDGLAALGLEVVPGQANYLLFRAAGAADLKERMLMRGVLIRSCANYHGLGNDWYRVCVGQAEQNRRLLAALKEVL